MRSLIVIVFVSLFASCGQDTQRDPKEPILLADREAPLGWIHLKIYQDSTFEFISRGIRQETIYPGRVVIHDDTLEFEYQDSIPKAGSRAVIKDRVVLYIAGDYPEAPEIKLNKITQPHQ
jgi:hypothetical protein